MLSRWLDRPGYVALVAALVAAIAAIIVLLIVLLSGDGGGDGGPAATSTPPATPATPAASATHTGTPATATPARFDDPDDALDAYIRDQLDAEHLGECPQSIPPGGEAPRGVCSRELYRSEELLTALLGTPFSEFFAEAVLTLDEDGLWSIELVPAPEAGGPGLETGVDAVVYGAGDCLNFRQQPSLSAAVVTCQLDGTRARVVDGPVTADGVTWWQLEGFGWASAEFLARASE
jgi:hypothetical protein